MAANDLLDRYLEDALEQLKADEVLDAGVVKAFLTVAADFNLLLRDQQASDLVRRRTAAAFGPDGAPIRAKLIPSP